MKLNTLTAIAFISADGSKSLTPFRNGEVSHRATVGRIAEWVLVLNEDMVVLNAAVVVGRNEDGSFRLSSFQGDAKAAVGLDLSEIIATTPWVRRRPTRYLELGVNPANGEVRTVGVMTPETLAEKTAAYAARQVA